MLAVPQFLQMFILIEWLLIVVAVLIIPRWIRRMPVRKQAPLLLFLAFINGVGFGGLAIYVHQSFIWAAILLPTLFGFLLVTLRCDRCGRLVYKKRVNVLDISITYLGGFSLPRMCTQCGSEFDDLGAQSAIVVARVSPGTSAEK